MFYSGLILGLALGFLLGAGVAIILPLLIMSTREARREEEGEIKRWSHFQQSMNSMSDSTAAPRR